MMQNPPDALYGNWQSPRSFGKSQRRSFLQAFDRFATLFGIALVGFGRLLGVVLFFCHKLIQVVSSKPGSVLLLSMSKVAEIIRHMLEHHIYLLLRDLRIFTHEISYGPLPSQVVKQVHDWNFRITKE
jgi:hypothetical protein